MQKDWLEDLVVRETMKLIQDDAVIDKIVQLVMDVQNQENTTIPLLEKQLREVNKKLDNLMKAIEDGLYTRTTKERLEALEIQKDTMQIFSIARPIGVEVSNFSVEDTNSTSYS